MKWVYSVKHKMKAALLLGVVLGLVVVKNLLDSSHVNQLGSSFSAVYEDRLVVESYIYQLSGLLYQKNLLVDHVTEGVPNPLLSEKIKEANRAITALLQEYDKTKLTVAEARYLGDLKHQVREIEKLETNYLGYVAAGEDAGQAKELLEAEYMAAEARLSELSHIQVEEGKRLNEESKQIIAGSAVLTQFEIILIISIGIMIQMLVFASKSGRSRFPQKPMLN